MNQQQYNCDSVNFETRINFVLFDKLDDYSVKVFRIHTDTEADNFVYHTNVHQYSSTKRKVFSNIACLLNLFSSLGPMLLREKCFFNCSGATILIKTTLVPENYFLSGINFMLSCH